MQVTDTVRAVHTAAGIRRAFFATVLSVQPPLAEDIGTNGEPTITIGFVDPGAIASLGGIKWWEAFKRVTTVRHVSHDEAQTGAAEYCYVDVLPRDGGPVVLAALNMSDSSTPAADAAAPEDTIGTIVYINHNNGLEVFRAAENQYRVHFEGEDFDFTDLFSAKTFADAKPQRGAEGINAMLEANPGSAVAEGGVYGTGRVIGSNHLFELVEFADADHPFVVYEQGNELARFGTQREADNFLIDRSVEKENSSGTITQTTIQPSAADLDAVAQQQAAKDATSGAGSAEQTTANDSGSGTKNETEQGA